MVSLNIFCFLKVKSYEFLTGQQVPSLGVSDHGTIRMVQGHEYPKTKIIIDSRTLV